MALTKYMTLSVLVTFLFGFNTNAKDAQAMDNPWAGVSSDSLLRKANYYHEVKEDPDSALFFYDLVINRYYQKKISADEAKIAISAFHDVATLYMYFYHDYFKAYSCYLQAQDLIDRYDLVEYQPPVSLNIANLMLADASLRNDTVSYQKTIKLYQQVFDSAFSDRNWNVA